MRAGRAAEGSGRLAARALPLGGAAASCAQWGFWALCGRAARGCPPRRCPPRERLPGGAGAGPWLVAEPGRAARARGSGVCVLPGAWRDAFPLPGGSRRERWKSAFVEMTVT